MGHGGVPADGISANRTRGRGLTGVASRAPPGVRTVGARRRLVRLSFGVLIAMGSGTQAGRRRWLLFTSMVLCCVAACRGSVTSPQKEIRVHENDPVTLSCYFPNYKSPRVEWKFTRGDVTSLVCYNGKITAFYEDRVQIRSSSSSSGIAFSKVTRADSGMYTCMVTDTGGNTYGEFNIELLVLVPPSKPTAQVPSSATIGSRAVLTCSEKEASPPPEFFWFKDGMVMPANPKASRVFSNSSYTLNQETGELIFDPVSAFDSGEYSCEARNGVGLPILSDSVHMEAAELNVGGIVAAVLVALVLLGLLIFSIWFAHRRGYFDRAKKGTPGKKVIYSQPSARSQGEFKQTSSFLV